jgi:5''-3'' exonuclease (including N-terminal domain of PolI)
MDSPRAIVEEDKGAGAMDVEDYATVAWTDLVACSHIQGMLSRTISMMERGIKPVYVFDGKPPELKAGEVSRGSRLCPQGASCPRVCIQ